MYTCQKRFWVWFIDGFFFVRLRFTLYSCMQQWTLFTMILEVFLSPCSDAHYRICLSVWISLFLKLCCLKAIQYWLFSSLQILSNFTLKNICLKLFHNLPMLSFTEWWTPPHHDIRMLFLDPVMLLTCCHSTPLTVKCYTKFSKRILQFSSVFQPHSHFFLM